MGFRCTIFICKFICKFLALFNRDGGNLPGLVGYKLNKKLLKCFKIKGSVIAVTGTNGKTSTTNLIYSLFSSISTKVICNKQGNNIRTGILSTLIKNCDYRGNVDCEYLILEVDEHYVPLVFSDLKLDSLIILNFFRDQLDRTCEVDILISKISSFLENYEGNLILNADDPNVARLARSNNKNKNICFFGVNKYNGSVKKNNEKMEGKYCPFCSSPLVYSYYQYSHIGKYKCSKCDFSNKHVDVLVENIDLNKKCFYWKDKLFKTKYNSIYNVYNIASVLTLSMLYDISVNVVYDCIKSFEINNGRFENIVVNNVVSTLNLAKNPTGVNVTLKIINEDDDSKDILFVLNDNIADGKDVSWIWDINFSVLNNVDRIITSGTRAYDIAVRIKNSGFDYKKIECFLDLSSAVASLYKTKKRKYVIFNYTAVKDTRKAILDYKDKVK